VKKEPAIIAGSFCLKIINMHCTVFPAQAGISQMHKRFYLWNTCLRGKDGEPSTFINSFSIS
jgi:hypothetical protein